MAFGLEAIDWTAPWLAPVRHVGQPLAALAGTPALGAGLTCAQVLNSAVPNAPVRFVAQADLPAMEAYEAYIFRTGQVPTRDGVHDFFNGLCWLHFPHTKRKLNQLQAAQISHSGIQPVRGPARDALTLLDENAAFFQGPDALWDALLAKDWQRLFITLRPLWSDTRLVLFGHALLEKLVYPREPITAHVFRVQAASNSIADVDVWVAAELCAEKLAGKPFAHLPVLGVPTWWSANENPAFYLDASVYRAARQSPHPIGPIGRATA